MAAFRRSPIDICPGHSWTFWQGFQQDTAGGLQQDTSGGFQQDTAGGFQQDTSGAFQQDGAKASVDDNNADFWASEMDKKLTVSNDAKEKGSRGQYDDNGEKIRKGALDSLKAYYVSAECFKEIVIPDGFDHLNTAAVETQRIWRSLSISHKIPPEDSYRAGGLMGSSVGDLYLRHPLKLPLLLQPCSNCQRPSRQAILAVLVCPRGPQHVCQSCGTRSDAPRDNESDLRGMLRERGVRVHGSADLDGLRKAWREFSTGCIMMAGMKRAELVKTLTERRMKTPAEAEAMDLAGIKAAIKDADASCVVDYENVKTLPHELRT